MPTISERLRRPLVDGVERMPGTCCAEAADTIDALVAALKLAKGALVTASVGNAAVAAPNTWKEIDAALALASKRPGIPVLEIGE